MLGKKFIINIIIFCKIASSFVQKYKSEEVICMILESKYYMHVFMTGERNKI